MATQLDSNTQKCVRMTKDNAHLEWRCTTVSSYITVTFFQTLPFLLLSFELLTPCNAVRGNQRFMEKYFNNNNNNNNNNNWDQPLTNQNYIQEEIKI